MGIRGLDASALERDDTRIPLDHNHPAFCRDDSN